MFDSMRFRSAALACLAVASLVACSGQDKTSSDAFTAVDSLMAYVPADTPYVFASGTPMSDDLLDKLEPATEGVLKAYQMVLREVMQESMQKMQGDAELKGGEGPSSEQMYAVMDELVSLMSIESLREAGISRGSRFALYGNGLMPVFRFQVTDPQLFEDAIVRIEDAAETRMDVADLDGNSYRYVGDEEASLVIGVFGNDAVITLAPTAFDDAQLKALFGLTKPANSIASSGRLAQMVSDYGFTDHLVGYFDTVRFASIFVEEPDGLDKVLFDNADYDPADTSAECEAEIRGMAGIVPLVVFGYDEVTEEVLGGRMIMELRDDLALAMNDLAAVVPGLGIDNGALASFGMSFDLEALRGFYEGRLDAMESNPYECEHFQDLQASVADGRAALEQPVPPMFYGIRGFNFSIDSADDLDFDSGAPPEDIDATFLLAIDDAEALLGMAAIFSPEIAGLDIKPDGKPVALDVQQVSMMGYSAYAAMSDDAIAVAVGDNAAERAANSLDADSASPPVTMAMAMNASVYYELMAKSLMRPTDDGEELSPEAREALADSFQTTSELYDRMTFDIRFTDRGLEFESDVTLAD